MSKYRSALQLSILIIAALSAVGCSSGGGGSGLDGQAANEAGTGVIITSPDAAEIDTTDDSMDLNGTASSDDDISSVSWESDRGKSGKANGKSSWKISNIPLETGTNTITVTATDASGKTRTDTIVIHRESEGSSSVTLSWLPPTERTDGTPLNNLAGFKISYGRMSEVYDYTINVDNAGLASYVVEELVPGDWYFAVVAYDTDGLESEFSNEAHRKIE